MENPHKERQLLALLESGRQMLECASLGDWEAVDKFQEQVHALSQALFLEPVTAAEAPVYADAIREILKINDSIMVLGGSAREACMKNVGIHRHKRLAIREYSENTG